MNPQIILIHPPVTKPAEPPAGIARLASCLQANNINYQIIDANLEGLLFLINELADGNNEGRWIKRARIHREENLAALRQSHTYANISRYGRIVSDLNRLLKTAGASYGVDLSLTDYQSRILSPVKSEDLINAAENPEMNPFHPYFAKRLEAALAENPEYIGFSLNYLNQALCTLAMIGFIKQRHPRQKIILGGSLITSWLAIGVQQNIFSGLIDEMIGGAGEGHLLQLLRKKKAETSYSLYYDDFASADYLAPGRILPYNSARGCYWHSCSFCPEAAEANPYLPQPPQKALAELACLCARYKPGLVHILDNALSPALLQALTEQPPGAPWYGFARIIPRLTDTDFCHALNKSGCVMLKLGIESGDQSTLDALNKGINLTDTARTLRALKNAGIASYVYLLFGTPPENEAGAKKTLDFVVEHHDCINFLNLAIFNLPVAGAAASDLAVQDFYAGDLSLYCDFHHPLGWERRKVRVFLDKTFRKHKAVATIMQNMPPFFKSSHAPFFIIHKTAQA